MRSVPSSEPLNIHFVSFWNPTAVTLCVWPSSARSGLVSEAAMSYSRVCGLPAATMYFLLGEISRQLTCESPNCSCW